MTASGETDRLDALDYYALLTIPRDAAPDAIRAGFHRFARRYHPDRYAGAAPEKIERATQIYRRGTEAYRVLYDDVTRRKYDEQLIGGKKRYDPSLLPPAEAARRSIPPASLPTARAAQVALRAGELDRARSLLVEALRHDPNNDVLRSAIADIDAKRRARL